ncbi:hypothetical protein ACMD2_25289 [Ananas comosus]|uniref:Uncharacterized protein n=1 Tax=Ananas comosus TaxID=4615 RepID=A0A199UMP5_ANACO|nr:hypothetical protein ACMD2_25289 [Ananas comosus]
MTNYSPLLVVMTSLLAALDLGMLS